MRKFSQQQRNYMVAEATYETAVKVKDWDLVEKVEDDYLDAESTLVHWMIEESLKTGKMPQKEAETLRDNWILEKYRRRIVDMAMSLAV